MGACLCCLNLHSQSRADTLQTPRDPQLALQINTMPFSHSFLIIPQCLPSLLRRYVLYQFAAQLVFTLRPLALSYSLLHLPFYYFSLKMTWSQLPCLPQGSCPLSTHSYAAPVTYGNGSPSSHPKKITRLLHISFPGTILTTPFQPSRSKAYNFQTPPPGPTT